MSQYMIGIISSISAIVINLILCGYFFGKISKGIQHIEESLKEHKDKTQRSLEKLHDRIDEISREVNSNSKDIAGLKARRE